MVYGQVNGEADEYQAADLLHPAPEGCPADAAGQCGRCRGQDAEPDQEPQGVSCAGPASCLAVGWSGPWPDGSRRLLAEAWTGTAWRSLSPARPGNRSSGVNGFSAVSCPVPGMCMAVGNYGIGRLAGHTLAERWNGRTWRLLSTPSPG